MPQKPSLSGVVANRLFNPSVWSCNDKAWKDVCQAENNNTCGGADRIANAAMWQAFEEVLPYLIGFLLTAEQQLYFKQKIEHWRKAYLKAFGEEHVFHYMICSLIRLSKSNSFLDGPLTSSGQWVLTFFFLVTTRTCEALKLVCGTIS